MFDPAALSLPTAPSIAAFPGAIPAPVIAENPGMQGAAAGPALAGRFDALLMLQSAQAAAAATASPHTAIALPESGKTLPDAAIAGRALQAPEEDPAEVEAFAAAFCAGPLHSALPDPALPDPALLAAIFAAPERLAPLPIDAKVPGSQAPVVITSPPASAMAQQPATAQAVLATVISVAQAAQIELAPVAVPFVTDTPADESTAPDATRVQPATPSAISARNARAVPLARKDTSGADTAAPSPQAAPPATVPSASARLSTALERPEIASIEPDTGPDITAPLIQRAANDIAPQAESAPVSRAEARAERIDFASLVDTLNRAREDASPNTMRVSVAHADFGRVSMRFDQDDTGLSVAMSSADPGFARAVTASNEAASAQTSADTPRGQSSQANGGNSQGEGNRQPQGQRNATPERPAAQLRDTLRQSKDAETPGGIFA